MRWIMLSLLLSGCGGTQYWTHVEPGYHAPVLWVKVADLDMERMCAGVSKTACAWRYTDACLVVYSSKADQCVLDHESKAHCKGWDHFTRQPYRNDCGDELPKG